MKCFIHINDEASAVCKKCGKAMCLDCSAYTNHSGICPECRREEFIQERTLLKERLRRNTIAIITSIIFAVIFTAIAIAIAVTLNLWGLIFLIVTGIFGIRVLVLFIKRRPINSRINFLTKEINKLGIALKRGSAVI